MLVIVTEIRLANSMDAEKLLALQHTLDRQSSFMLLEPQERDDSAENLQVRLADLVRAGSFDLIAVDEDRAVGWLSVDVAPYRRARHTGYVVTGVDAESTGQGIGTSLITCAVAEAELRGLIRLELTVMTDNLRALNLYLRCGFQVEGIRRSALHRDGVSIHEYYMARLLQNC
jgi:RimJ/RimL family protein N-acetyltransferase